MTTEENNPTFLSKKYDNEEESVVVGSGGVESGEQERLKIYECLAQEVADEIKNSIQSAKALNKMALEALKDLPPSEATIVLKELKEKMSKDEKDVSSFICKLIENRKKRENSERQVILSDTEAQADQDGKQSPTQLTAKQSLTSQADQTESTSKSEVVPDQSSSSQTDHHDEPTSSHLDHEEPTSSTYVDQTSCEEEESCISKADQKEQSSKRQLPHKEQTSGPHGPNEEKIKALLEKTGYSLEVSSGQRKYGGPPPGCTDPPPPNGHELYCGKIPRDMYEDELVPLFEKYGKLWDVRLMMDPVQGRNRGFCFVTYCLLQSANDAVKELNNYEIKRGKLLKVNIADPNCRLFIGNIPKTKSKEELMEELKKHIDGIVDVIVYGSPDDLKIKNRGFAFVDFDSHRSASAARRRIMIGRLVLWGLQIICDWAEPLDLDPSEEVMAKVKVLYIRNLKSDITEQALRSMFEKFGSIDRVKKVKSYGFVHFNDRDSAVEAIKQMHGTKVSDVEIDVSLAKPFLKNKMKENNNNSNNKKNNQHHQQHMYNKHATGYHWMVPFWGRYSMSRSNNSNNNNYNNRKNNSRNYSNYYSNFYYDYHLNDCYNAAYDYYTYADAYNYYDVKQAGLMHNSERAQYDACGLLHYLDEYPSAPRSYHRSSYNNSNNRYHNHNNNNKRGSHGKKGQKNNNSTNNNNNNKNVVPPCKA